MTLEAPYTILFVHSSDELYGADVVLYELTRRLHREKFRPLVVVPTDLPYKGELSTALQESGVPVYRVNMGVLRRRYFNPLGAISLGARFLWGTQWLWRLIRRENVALVHSNTSAVLCGAYAAALANRPHVWHVHEIIERPYSVRRFLSHHFNHYTDWVVAISNAVRDQIRVDTEAVDSRLTVIPDAVDTEKFNPAVSGQAVRREWGITPDQLLFGVVGRVHYWKGQDVFIEAAAEVAAAVPKARFVVVGDVVPGSEHFLEPLKTRVQELGLAERFIWAGYRQDTPEVMAALDALVLPSTLPEPFGMVLLEAMATGQPVIASAHGGPLEIIVAEETGLFFQPGSAPHLAQAMIRLAENPELRRQLGRGGKKRAEQQYSFAAHVTAFEMLYESILTERNMIPR